MTVTRQARRAALAGGVGSIVEWYDYGLYGIASALYIRPLFFGSSAGLAGYLLTFATFAVGFVARPIGGIVLGYLGDRYGRKPVLLGTLLLMGGSTTLMGALPTGAALGTAAPLLLVTLRVLQGFGAGAELAGAFVYVTESSPGHRQAYLASYSSAATAAGLFLSTALFAVLEAVLPRPAMLAYGWRIPFLVSVFIVIFALAIRSRIEESAPFRQRREDPRTPHQTRDAAGGPRRVAAGLLAPTIIGVGAYVTSVYAVSYLTSSLGVSAGLALTGVLTLAAVSTVTCVLFGALADRIGARRVFVGGAVFSAVFAFPFFLLLRTGEPALIILALAANYAIGWAACAGAQGKVLPALFGTARRFSGVAITRELNSALLAGPAPFVAAALTGAAGGSPWLVAVLLIAASAATIIGVALAPRDRAPAPNATEPAGAPGGGPADAVRDAERRRCRAIADRDPEALAAVLSDDLRYLHSTGVLEAKPDYIRTSVTGTPRTVERGPLDVRVFTDVAVVTGAYTIHIAPDEENPAGRHVPATGLQIWTRATGPWLLLAHQGTPAPP